MSKFVWVNQSTCVNIDRIECVVIKIDEVYEKGEEVKYYMPEIYLIDREYPVEGDTFKIEEEAREWVETQIGDKPEERKEGKNEVCYRSAGSS